MSTAYGFETSVDSDAAHWTWADIVSTYRFWALLISYVLSGAMAGAFSVLLSRLAIELGVRFTELTGLASVRFLSQLIGFYIAYAAARSKPLRVLMIAAVLQLVGSLLVTVPGAGTPVDVRTLGAVCWGAGYGALFIDYSSRRRRRARWNEGFCRCVWHDPVTELVAPSAGDAPRFGRCFA